MCRDRDRGSVVGLFKRAIEKCGGRGGFCFFGGGGGGGGDGFGLVSSLVQFERGEGGKGGKEGISKDKNLPPCVMYKYEQQVYIQQLESRLCHVYIDSQKSSPSEKQRIGPS